MMIPLILVAVFVGVAAFVGAVALMFRRTPDEAIAERLEAFARNSPGRSVGKENAPESSLLASPLDDMPGLLEATFSRFTNLRALLDQAGVSISPTNFFVAIFALGGVGVTVTFIMRMPLFTAPILGLALASLPVLWLLFKRKRRMKAFARQLPASLELMSRALRAGHSLAAGLQLVSEELPDPLGSEFLRTFEEQNLGVPLAEALDSLSVRVPNLDVRFFVTAVVLQKQTGGDLAEILDKIATLVRERFKLLGEIQALTGEGRLSGLILLAMPPLLFAGMYNLNRDYVMLLFTDPVGKQMLALALGMQLVGALVIRKIINIKV